ncbi:conserved hypothetical protein [Trichinella spiralis]|uniref:hypothetical protein n=1 Tax=Trichinella spiralis TaxID=6334 RepID=UPI0001EFEAFC|nr:conserved hypothetical protein [Trichinella spiralis]
MASFPGQASIVTDRSLEQARPLFPPDYWCVRRYLATGRTDDDVTTKRFPGNLPTPRTHVNNYYRTPPLIFMSNSSYARSMSAAEEFHQTPAGSMSCNFRIDLTSVPAAVFNRALLFMPSDERYNSKILPSGQLLLV